MTAAHPQLPEPDYSVLPPRRAQVRLSEPQLRALFGLEPDESLISVRYDTQRGGLTAIVESPRLRPVGYECGPVGEDGKLPFQPAWDIDPPYITLPISDFYEPQDGKPYPSILTFPIGKDSSVSVALCREDGVLTPAASTKHVGLTAEQEAEVERVCAAHSVPK